MATVWTLVQHNLADLVQNWDLQRPYTASLATRVEGFTEEWGGAANDTTALLDDTPPTIATLHPPCKIRLFQYRPAWGEQLALRIATIQYVVVNSKYAVNWQTVPVSSSTHRVFGIGIPLGLVWMMGQQRRLRHGILKSMRATRVVRFPCYHRELLTMQISEN